MFSDGFYACLPSYSRLIRSCFFPFFFFFFNDTATTEIYTLSLHDALPICNQDTLSGFPPRNPRRMPPAADRKSTRLNSSHQIISYAVFCLKKKKNTIKIGPASVTEPVLDNETEQVCNG